MFFLIHMYGVPTACPVLLGEGQDSQTDGSPKQRGKGKEKEEHTLRALEGR